MSNPHMQRQAQQIIAGMDAEARATFTHTRADYAAFKALTPEAKAARWRTMNQAGKEDLVIQALREQGTEWTPELVALHVGKLDARWK